MNKQQLLSIAKKTVYERREKAVADYERTLAQLRAHVDFADCETKLKAAQVEYALHNDAASRKEVEKYSALRLKLLKKYRVSEDDLRPKYYCTKCGDTGYVLGKTCTCLQEEMRKAIISQSTALNKSFTFENSKETDKHNVAVYKKAKEVCANGTLKNILLTGTTGTGKTYLLCACANYCAELGKTVLLVTAYGLNSMFLTGHVSNIETKNAVMENLTDVDVLIVDDLGTENVYKNVTAEYLFALLNERISCGKQTFFSTNLTLSDIRERYDERLFSRIVNQEITFVAKLEGADKRLIKQ